MWWRLDRDNTEYNQAGSDHSPFVDLTYFKDHTEDFPYNADDPVNGGYQNRYVYELDDKRTLEAGKWATICTPFNIDDYETVFGEGTKVAVLVKSEHEEMGVRDDMYHLTFHVIDARQMQADTPYLIKPGKNTVVTMYDNTTTDHAMTPEHWTREVKTSVFDTNEPTTEVFMIGKFLKYNLSKAEFYVKNFKNEDDEWQMGFYKAKTDGGSSISPFKCFFRIEKEGVAITEAKMGSMLMEEEDHGVTEITAISLHENHPAPIYTLDGRRMNGISAETLPNGIYIMNGKKWPKK